jgi:hypothetical protein
VQGESPFVCRTLKLVCFVYLVHLVCFVQPNKQDKPNKPNNGLLLLAGFFSVLLIVRWFKVARRSILPGDRRLLGLFNEAT